MDNLHDYYFHYNSITGEWNALEIIKLQDFHAGKINKKEILKNKDINILIKFLSNKDIKFISEE